MKDKNKIKIGKFEYTLCTDEDKKEYLYRYDIDNGIGIKLRFSNEDNSRARKELLEMLSKQYIERIIMSKKY